MPKPDEPWFDYVDDARDVHRDGDLWVTDRSAGDRSELPRNWRAVVDGHWTTSGLNALAGSPKAAKQLASSQVRYIAVIEGRPASRGGNLKGDLRWRIRREGPGWTTVSFTGVASRCRGLLKRLSDGRLPVRGDVRNGDSVDVRAARPLLHCERITLPDGRRFEAEPPADMARYVGRPAAAVRAGLEAAPDTDTFRVLNGRADGAPGTLVDRYGEWLWARVDVGSERVDLPEAAGQYRLDALVDRSRGQQMPARLVAGREAPPSMAVVEAGVNYRVGLGARLSTGLFLDQRPQRAWLARNAGGMRVLNTFAHACAFSVAAALAGAETVSVDLSRSWLAQLEPQLVDNGLTPDAHRTLKGDVFEHLEQLAAAGERFDIVILDPPSTSVGTRKRRWAAAKDYPALARLAARTVAPGGALWACTNHRGLSPRRFSDLVQSGLPPQATLERACPPGVDFPVDDEPAPLKAHIWRL